jgi:hypothetical protein
MEDFINKLNIQVIRGLRTISKRVDYCSKIQITDYQYKYLKKRYNLKFKLSEIEEFMNEHKILRAYFKSKKGVSKIVSLKMSVSLA